MNNPKEKANELIEKYAPIMPNEDWKEKAKQCAIIAVDEIIKINPTIETRVNKNNCSWLERKSNIEYWQEVKQEIENL